MTSRGILGWGAYLPRQRLDRAAIPPVAGGGGGTGTRSVAGYDEDATTMGVAAARLALRGVSPGPRVLWFATAEPPYLDKTNATAVHAALRLDPGVAAYDAVGSVRSAMAALRAAHDSSSSALVVAAGLRTGLPGGPDEASGGDAAAALLIGPAQDSPAQDGPAQDSPVLAELRAWASATEEFLDRWRIPGDPASRRWEERFGESRYTTLGAEALDAALAQAAIAPADVTALVVAGYAGTRAARTIAAKAGVPPERLAGDLGTQVGNPGAAQPALLLAATLEALGDGEDRHVVLLTLADGADAAVFRTTGALAGYRPARPVADQLAARHARQLRHLPALARDAGVRAAAPPRAVPPVGPGRSPRPGLQVRLHRLRPQFRLLRHRPAAAVAAGRRPAPDGRSGRHHRRLHRGPPRLLAEPAGDLRRTTSWRRARRRGRGAGRVEAVERCSRTSRPRRCRHWCPAWCGTTR